MRPLLPATWRAPFRPSSTPARRERFSTGRRVAMRKLYLYIRRSQTSARPLGRLGDCFDSHVHRGRDRDRLVERSTAFVVVDEIDGLRLARALEAEPDLDPLKDRGVRPLPDAFDGGLSMIQANAGIPRPPLHQQHPASRNACQERLRRSDLFTRAAEMRCFVDNELVVADLVEGPSGYSCADGMHPIDDDVIAGHVG